MRFIPLTTIAAVALGCGGEKKPDTTQTSSSAPAASGGAAPAAAAAGPLIEVRMTGDGTRKAAFEPSVLTVTPGTTVRFVNVSGGPHNVAFWPESLPPGGAAALKASMPNQMTTLTGPFLTQANDHYDVAFTGAPVGLYKGYCQPHIVLGMRVAIIVK